MSLQVQSLVRFSPGGSPRHVLGVDLTRVRGGSDTKWQGVACQVRKGGGLRTIISLCVVQVAFTPMFLKADTVGAIFA